MTGNLAPYFLTVCKPNYTALGCQQALRYISHQEACTGNQDDILRARKTFPSKEAALSVYAALYLAVSYSAPPFTAPFVMSVIDSPKYLLFTFLSLNFQTILFLNIPLGGQNQNQYVYCPSNGDISIPQQQKGQ